MSIVVSTDHTRSMFGLYGQTTALVLCWVACDGCKVRITNLRIGGSEWDTAMVVAEADANGCRWTVDDRTSRPYCPVCQRRRTRTPRMVGRQTVGHRAGAAPDGSWAAFAERPRGKARRPIPERDVVRIILDARPDPV